MKRVCIATATALALLNAEAVFAIDSYRYLHVSIETPWTIFLFLLVAVFAPFILMVVLMWRRPAEKPRAATKSDHASDE
ncbi:MAG: hypothetical protein WA807_05645 [Steroidobacteraceae bacterium]